PPYQALTETPRAAKAILRSEYGPLPDDFRDLFDLYSLLWEKEVGTRFREHERETARKEAALAAQYAETQKLVVELDLKGNLNAKLGDAARALKGFDRATSNTQQSLSKFGRNIERGIVLGAAAAAGGFVAVAKAAGDFEAEMNTIATIVDRKDIARIGEALRKTARDTGISLEDLTSAYYDLASAGVKGQLATDALN